MTFTNTPGVDASPANSTFTINAGQKAFSVTVKKYSDIAILTARPGTSVKGLVVEYGKTATDLQKVEIGRAHV